MSFVQLEVILSVRFVQLKVEECVSVARLEVTVSITFVQFEVTVCHLIPVSVYIKCCPIRGCSICQVCAVQA
jgi:hypothetical protein